MRVELPALAHGDAHDAEKVGALEVGDDFHIFALGRDVAGNAETPRIAGSVVSHWQMRGEGGGGDTRRRSHALQKCGLEGEAALLGVSRPGKSHACRKTVGGVKAGGAVRNIERRPREQATADQDYKADAELQAEQHAPPKLVARTTCYRRATFMKGLVLGDTQGLTHRVDAAGQRDRRGDSGDKEINALVTVQVEGQWHAVVGEKHVEPTCHGDAGRPSCQPTAESE